MATTKSSIIAESVSDHPTIIRGSGNVYQIPIERLSKANPANVQEIAASQIALLSTYHKEVLDQAKMSFRWAIVAAGIGLVFFLAAIAFQLFQPSNNISIISLVGGTIIEFISAINFYLYGKTASQMAEFQTRLDKTQCYLLANSICESLTGEHKNRSRAELIRSIVGISLNGTIEEGSGSIPSPKQKQE